MVSTDDADVTMILVDMSSPFKRKEGLDTIRLLRNHALSASIPIVAVCDATRDDGVLQEGTLVSFTYQLILAMPVMVTILLVTVLSSRLK